MIACCIFCQHNVRIKHIQEPRVESRRSTTSSYVSFQYLLVTQHYHSGCGALSSNRHAHSRPTSGLRKGGDLWCSNNIWIDQPDCKTPWFARIVLVQLTHRPSTRRVKKHYCNCDHRANNGSEINRRSSAGWLS